MIKLGNWVITAETHCKIVKVLKELGFEDEPTVSIDEVIKIIDKKVFDID